MRRLDDFLVPFADQTVLQICEQHGQYASRRLFMSAWSTCPHCTAAREEQDRLEQARARAATAMKTMQERIGRSGIPERFADRTLANYVATSSGQQHALAFSQAYAEGFATVLKQGRCALFTGMPGTGKTHLAVGIARHVMENAYSALFITTIQAVRSIKETWRDGAKLTETQAIRALCMPDLLVLDEVGVQFGSETERILIFDVLNERYTQRKPTLLISNCTLDEVSRYLGARIMDRMREDGAEQVTFTWASHRVKE